MGEQFPLRSGELVELTQQGCIEIFRAPLLGKQESKGFAVEGTSVSGAKRKYANFERRSLVLEFERPGRRAAVPRGDTHCVVKTFSGFDARRSDDAVLASQHIVRDKGLSRRIGIFQPRTMIHDENRPITSPFGIRNSFAVAGANRTV